MDREAAQIIRDLERRIVDLERRLVELPLRKAAGVGASGATTATWVAV